jgi:hypothetical protein
MITRVHFTYKDEAPLSKAPSELPVVLVDDDNKIVEEGLYWMKGSREYLPMLTAIRGRFRKGEYWYSVAEKAGQRFARQYTKYGVRCFRLPDSFVRKIKRDVCLHMGKAGEVLESSFKYGFFSQIQKDDPALYKLIFDEEDGVEKMLFMSKKVVHLQGYSLIFAGLNRHEKPCVLELLSELSKTDRLINNPQLAIA